MAKLDIRPITGSRIARSAHRSAELFHAGAQRDPAHAELFDRVARKYAEKAHTALVEPRSFRNW